MHLLGKPILYTYIKRHKNISNYIGAWICEVESSSWKKPLDIKNRYSSASFISENRVIFNIKGNSFRLLVKVNYQNQIVIVLKIDTHENYNKWKIE